MNTTSYFVANEIRMKRTQFHGAFLICEGATDSRFLRRLVDTTACQIVVARDKDTALGAISLLDDGGVNGCLAIVDADFDRLLGGSYQSRNVIATPVHDMDVLLFNSRALDKILDEYGSSAKLQAFAPDIPGAVRSTVRAAAVHLGLLRYVSLIKGLNLRFEGLKVSSFAAHDSLKIDRQKLVRVIKNNSQNHALGDAYLIAEIDSVLKEGHSVEDVCVGHDLSAILAYGLRKVLGSADPRIMTAEFVETQLRVSYEQAWFPSEVLHASIREWEAKNTPFRILRE